MDRTRSSKKTPRKHHSNTHQQHNTIHRYLFIGGLTTYFFKLHKNETQLISQFISPIGNNDFPYPYAKTDKNIYFLIEKQLTPITLFNNTHTNIDLYGEFYKNNYSSHISTHKINIIKSKL